MKEDLFTFSIQEAETLGIECAIVLTAVKGIKISSSSPSEITKLLLKKIPFLNENKISEHVNRLIDLKLISPSLLIIANMILMLW